MNTCLQRDVRERFVTVSNRIRLDYIRSGCHHSEGGSRIPYRVRQLDTTNTRFPWSNPVISCWQSRLSSTVRPCVSYKTLYVDVRILWLENGDSNKTILSINVNYFSCLSELISSQWISKPLKSKVFFNKLKL